MTTVLYVALFLFSPIIVIVGFKALFAISVWLISSFLTLGLFVIDKIKETRNEERDRTKV